MIERSSQLSFRFARILLAGVSLAAAVVLCSGSPSEAGKLSYVDLGVNLKRTAQDKIPYSQFACVNWDTRPGAKRPYRFRVNSRKALPRARAVVRRYRAENRVSIRVLRRAYTIESQYVLANTVRSQWAPTGLETGNSVGTLMEGDQNDSANCARIVLLLVSTPSHPLSDVTRQWAAGVVARYGSDRILLREVSQEDSAPAVSN